MQLWSLCWTGFAAEQLLSHEKRLRARVKAIEGQVIQLTGCVVNLSSASQLANALYLTLGLPPPSHRSDRYTSLPYFVKPESMYNCHA